MTAPPPQRNARQSAWFRGQAAERYASLVLRFKGYRILARQYRTPLGEIDIIAQRGGSLVFVEVKARATERLALESLGRRQRDRIVLAAKAFLQSDARYASCSMRFDAILVVPWRWPVHVKDAWQEN